MAMHGAELKTIEVASWGNGLPGFTFAMPVHWQLLPFPRTNSAHNGPFDLEPLAIAAAPESASFLTIGTRPAPLDGSLRDWLEHYRRSEDLQINSIRKFAAGPMRGFLYSARQNRNGITTALHNLLVEDGGRLYSVCAMGTEPVFPPLDMLLATLAESFCLPAATGPTMSLYTVPDEPFHSSLGLTIPVPPGWAAYDDGACAVISQPGSGARIRVGRIAHDPAVFDKLQRSYARTNPHADAMFAQVDGVAVFTLSGIRIPETGATAVHTYFVQPLPQQHAMYIAQVTIPAGAFRAAMATASNVLAALPR